MYFSIHLSCALLRESTAIVLPLALRMKSVINASAENYLETIYELSQMQSEVRSIDVAETLGYSKPSVSRAVSLLKQGGYLLMNEHGHLALTETGKAVAEKVFERHTVITGLLTALGVDEAVAAEDACKIEHVISEQTFLALKEHLRRYS